LPPTEQAANASPAAAYLLTTPLDLNSLPAPGAGEPGRQIPLVSVTTIETGTFINVNTGQETIISPLSVPMEGVYVNKEDPTAILVVRYDEETRTMVILRGLSSSGIEIGTKTQVSKKIDACN